MSSSGSDRSEGRRGGRKGRGKGKGKARSSRSRSASSSGSSDYYSEDEALAAGGKLAGMLREKLREAAREVRRQKQLDSDAEAFAHVFNDIDKDGSGDLSRGEFERALRKLNVKASSRGVTFLMECFDVDGKGKIDYKEFEEFVMYSGEGKELGALVFKLRSAVKAAALASAKAAEDGSGEGRHGAGAGGGDRLELKRTFAKLDRTGDGTLTVDEFKRGLRKLGFEATEDEMTLLMRRFDKNGDGKVNYKEFARFVDPQRDLRPLLRRLRAVTEAIAPKKLKSAFAARDPKSRGYLPQNKFAEVLVTDLDCPLNDRELRQLIYRNQVDAPKRGKSRADEPNVDYKEFCRWIDAALRAKEDLPAHGTPIVLDSDKRQGDDWFATNESLLREALGASGVAAAVEAAADPGAAEILETEAWAAALDDAWEAHGGKLRGGMPVEHVAPAIRSLGFPVTDEAATAGTTRGADVSRREFDSRAAALIGARLTAGLSMRAELYLRSSVSRYDTRRVGAVSAADLEAALRSSYPAFGSSGSDEQDALVKRVVAAAPKDVEEMIDVDRLVLVVRRVAAGEVLPCMRSHRTRIGLRILAAGPPPDAAARSTAVKGLPGHFSSSILRTAFDHPSQQLGAALAPTIDTPAVPPTAEGAAAAAGGAAQAPITVFEGVVSADSTVGADSLGGVALRYSDLLVDLPTRANRRFGGSHALGPMRPLDHAAVVSSSASGAPPPMRASLLECVLRLVSATAVPIPDHAHRGVIVERHVRVSLVDKQPPRATGELPRLRTVGNQHHASVRWPGSEVAEDEWYFGAKKAAGAPDDQWLVRTDHPRLGSGCSADDLYVLFELTMRTKPLTDTRDHTPRTELAHARGAPNEYAVAWGMHQLYPLATLRSRSKVVVPLHGGTVLAEYDISDEDIRQHRSGWRRVSHALTGSKVPRLMLRASPVAKLPAATRAAVAYMPLTVQVAIADMELVRLYRECLASALLGRDVPQGWDGDVSASVAAPHIHVFRLAASEPAAMAALRAAWVALPKTRAQRKNRQWQREAFARLVLRMWPAFAESAAAQRSDPRDEAFFKALLDTEDDRAVFNPDSSLSSAVEPPAPFSVREVAVAVDSMAPWESLR